MEGNAIERNAVLVLVGLDFDTVRVVGAGFVQRQNVRGDEAVPYGAVVGVLALLQRAGFKNAGLPVDANAANRILEPGG